MDVELKPCPFCGSSMESPSWVLNAADSAERLMAVMCWQPHCGAQGAMYRTEAEAIAAWNRRDESHTRAAVEAERAACEAVASAAAGKEAGEHNYSRDRDVRENRAGGWRVARDIANAIAARKAQP